MIALFFVQPIMDQTIPADPAIAICEPALAGRAGGDIASIDVDSVNVTGKTRTIRGRLTAFSHMGPAPAGVARTHHVIRVDYSFRCDVRNGKVSKARVTLFRPEAPTKWAR